jgi:hypothetical protein
VGRVAETLDVALARRNEDLVGEQVLPGEESPVNLPDARQVIPRDPLCAGAFRAMEISSLSL